MYVMHMHSYFINIPDCCLTCILLFVYAQIVEVKFMDSVQIDKGITIMVRGLDMGQFGRESQPQVEYSLAIKATVV